MLSTRCTYGLLAALHLARHAADGYVPVRCISEELALSPHFLAKVVRELTQAGLVKATRGPKGGVALQRPAEDITLKDLVLLFDGSRLFDGELLEDAELASDAPLVRVWSTLQRHADATLSQLTLADLVRTDLHPDEAAPLF